MAQIFQLNDQNLEYITGATWDENSAGSPLAGGAVFNRHRRHRWQTNVMSAAEYESIRGRLGQKVSLTTTDYDNLNCDYVTYYGATLDTVSGEHAGPIYLGVQAEFTVRL